MPSNEFLLMREGTIHEAKQLNKALSEATEWMTKSSRYWANQNRPCFEDHQNAVLANREAQGAPCITPSPVSHPRAAPCPNGAPGESQRPPLANVAPHKFTVLPGGKDD